MTNLVGLWRRSRIEAPLAAYRSAYARVDGDVSAIQLDILNTAWAESLARSPWARALRDRLALPDRFGDWTEFTARTPIQRKPDLRADLATAVAPPADLLWRATGGTTAEPMKFPVFTSETLTASLDIWLGRDRLGIRPDDRLFMIWGHSHIFGAGLAGSLARWRRRASDLALGYTRWNAYRLSDADLALAGEALLRSGARYVIGYSTALDRFARANMRRSGEFARLGLKAVIATAEGFPRADSRGEIAACFGVPVVMEYGSMETGPIAYERVTGEGYDVFWRHHRLELAGEPAADGARELVVTSLYPRAMPLLRYAIGDLAVPAAGGVLTGVRSILGRCNEHIDLPDGTAIHSEAFTHAVRGLPGVRAYQIVRRASARLPVIRIESSEPLPASTLKTLRAQLHKVHPDLADVRVELISFIPPSLAGKHRMVIEEP
ncbi:MAG: hypothetical protein Q8L23_08550 [Caulobacter sp.]|nr:hypothetical protein [Caulobacter sp.]